MNSGPKSAVAVVNYRRRPPLSAHEQQPTATSPYSVHYKAPLSNENRTLIVQRSHIAKWPRADLEDKYLRMLDEHYALKKDNLSNHEKIRKLVTRVMRLTGQTFAPITKRSLGPPSNSATPMNDDEMIDVLQLRVIDLESNCAQLRSQLQQAAIAQYNRGGNGSHRSRCTSASTIRGSSTGRLSSLMLKNKPNQFKSQENIRTADENADADPVTRDTSAQSDTVSEQEIVELKVIIEQLQEELQAGVADKIEAQECVNCRELQATRDELDRIKVITQLGAEEINRKLAEQDKQFELQLDIYRTQIDNIRDRLDKEMAANKQLTTAKEDVEQLLRAAQQTQQDSEDINAENASLKKHRENIAQLANELARRNESLRELRLENETLRTEVGDTSHYVATLEQDQAERMERMRALQDSHDSLAVQLEGVRAQCACLEMFSRSLEVENRRLQESV